uniref:Uncharacterized protein n=1 Tax=Canis lupus dingo TaxID=286419 RepID=A0A8C0KWD4_CANLU
MVGASALSGGFWLSSTNSDPVLLFQAIESAIGGNAYQHSKVNQWTTNVVEQTLSQLTKLGKPFKYIGNSQGAHHSISQHFRSDAFTTGMWCGTGTGVTCHCHRASLPR